MHIWTYSLRTGYEHVCTDCAKPNASYLHSADISLRFGAYNILSVKRAQSYMPNDVYWYIYIYIYDACMGNIIYKFGHLLGYLHMVILNDICAFQTVLWVVARQTDLLTCLHIVLRKLAKYNPRVEVFVTTEIQFAHMNKKALVFVQGGMTLGINKLQTCCNH